MSFVEGWGWFYFEFLGGIFFIEGFFVFGKQQLNNCFWKIRVALKRDGLVRLVRANPLIWADSAIWTGWEVLTVHDEWKMTLVTVLAEVERVKMAVVCQSADTVAHLE